MTERLGTSDRGELEGPDGGRTYYLLPAGDSIDTRRIGQVLWAGRFKILVLSLLFGLVGLGYSLLAQSWYRAEILLIPNERDPVSGIASQLSQFGGLASLAGITMGASKDKVTPIAVLKSRDFARAFIEDEKLLTVLFSRKWDSDALRWKVDPDRAPDIRDAVKFFQKRVLRISEDRKTGLVTLAVDWTDPVLAASWASSLVVRVNEQARQRALADAERNIAFLQKELSSTNLVSMQQSIGRLLEAELQKLMLARGAEEYSFRVIDAAEVPKRRIRPQRTLLILVSILVGALIGAGFVLLREQVKEWHRVAA